MQEQPNINQQYKDFITAFIKKFKSDPDRDYTGSFPEQNGITVYFNNDSEWEKSDYTTIKLKGFELSLHDIIGDVKVEIKTDLPANKDGIVAVGVDVVALIKFLHTRLDGDEKGEAADLLTFNDEPVIRTETVTNTERVLEERGYTDADYYTAKAKADLYDQITSSPAHSVKFGTEL